MGTSVNRTRRRRRASAGNVPRQRSLRELREEQLADVPARVPAEVNDQRAFLHLAREVPPEL
eukprot:30358-Pelagococcus_subviridis.AAC.9